MRLFNAILPSQLRRCLPFPGSFGGAISSSDAYLQRLEVRRVTLERLEHLAHRHALDSILGLDQDQVVGLLIVCPTDVPFKRGIEIVEVPPIPWLMPRFFRGSADDMVRFMRWRSRV